MDAARAGRRESQPGQRGEPTALAERAGRGVQGADQAVVEACEMAAPHELEAEVLGEIGDSGETVVAFALLRRQG